MIDLLTTAQEQVLHLPLQQRIFLEGPAGCGKTTVGVERALQWIESGVPANEILILVPQRSLAHPYYEALRSPNLPPGGMVDIMTLGGIGQRMISLFWPLFATEVGFVQDDRPPSFLTLETAQYVMAGIIQPYIERDEFLSVNLDPNRMLSQILDNLNKAASFGYPHTEVAERLSQAWIGDKADQIRLYETAQSCANEFRAYCYENNLLDFSLQLQLFTKYLWHTDACRSHLMAQYRYLIYDNAEEDIPVAHDVVLDWLPHFDGAMIIHDSHAGFRLFLGADAQSALRLRDVCDQDFSLADSLVPSEEMEQFSEELQAAIQMPQKHPIDPILGDVFTINTNNRFYPQMIADVAEQVAKLVNQQGFPAEEIVVLAPFLSDSLRFSLERALAAQGIPSYTTRPSRSLSDEPVTRSLLSWAKLGNPAWGTPPIPTEVNVALMQSIAGLDWVRADLLRSKVYLPNAEDGIILLPFASIHPILQDRITYQVGERYDHLRKWLQDLQKQQEKPELDIFLSRIFGEVLSQPGFAFHTDIEAAAVTSRLIESVSKFRRGVHLLIQGDEDRIGAEYIAMIERGVIAAQYLQAWEPQPKGTVLLAPAHTFLMQNRPARIQFWLDVGNAGWWQRLYQPLTHPIVLSRHWPGDRKWTDLDEMAHNTSTLQRLMGGLIRRCSEHVFLYTTEVDQSGYESQGMLILALQNILRRMNQESALEEGADV
ncbi:MAG: UvrD-helicase domain-containing protein [Anaerolineae bacterium]|jgi:hypothetical protein|nr:UvrD-helicase domain-containing protein [Anaerolineae bacterium]